MQNRIVLPVVALMLALVTACGSKSFTGSAETSSSSLGSDTATSTEGSTSNPPSVVTSPPVSVPVAVPQPAPVAVPQPAPVAVVQPTPVVVPQPAPIAAAPVVQGNAIINGSGQQLSFVNEMGRSIGSASGSLNGGDFQVQLLNSYTGRTATVTVVVDPSSGAFLAVNAASAQPYMCHDPSADPCAIYPDATTQTSELNCDSPIFFRGALNGSVNNITLPASTQCQAAAPMPTPIAIPIAAPVASPICEITIASGQVLHANQPSKELCQAICRDYASDSTICKFKGQVIPYGYND